MAPRMLAAACLLSVGLPVLTAQAAPADPPQQDAAAPAWHLETADRGLTWRKAATRCQESTADGRSDWYLPTAGELARLAERATDGGGDARSTIDASLSWLRPLDVETDSALLWPCEGEQQKPVLTRSSLQAFRHCLPPGPFRDTVAVDFVVDQDGEVRLIGPSPGTPDRFGRLAVSTLDTFHYRPATCDGKPIAVFYHLDFGG